MTKDLNEDVIGSELSGSAFFQPAGATNRSETPVSLSVEAVSTMETDTDRTETPNAAASARPAGDPDGAPSHRASVRRTITRYAYEIFQDQVESLRDWSLAEKHRGEKGSMSQMVREAIDMYLARRHRSEG